MANLANIREGIAANLAALDDIQVSPYLLANPTPPCIHVFPGPIDYDEAGSRGLDKWTLTVQAFVPLSADIGSQVVLDGFIASAGAQSVKAAIEADSKLGGACSDLRVVSCSGYRQFVFEGRPPCLGVDFVVEIYATGS